MRCRDCGYVLWGISTGRCPECDAPFKPSEFRFRPRAVSFACPKCHASYAGTSDRGHLDPTAFSCVTCGTPLTMDQMALEPARGVTEADTMPEPNPWLDRARIGRPKAFFKTIAAVVFDPTQFMLSIIDRNPRDGTMGDAVSFYAVMSALAMLVMMTFGAALSAVLVYLLPRPIAGSAVLLVAFPSALGVGILFAAVVWPVIEILAGHLGLMIADARRGGLTRTAQSVLYCNAAMAPASFILGFVPLGGLVAMGWRGWVMTVLFREAHRTTTARAVVGTIFAIATPILLALGLALLALLGVFAAASRAEQAAVAARARAAAVSSGVDLQATTDALTAFQLEHDRWPATPLELVADGRVTPQAFLRLIGQESENDGVVVRGVTAKDIAALGDRLHETSKELAATMATNELPFRIGRAVFAYRMSDGDPDDWLVVVFPAREGDPIRVLRGAGGELVVPPDQFDVRLEELNRARKKRFLVPLPDPRHAPAL